MEITIKGSAKEIAALAVEVQERLIEEHDYNSAVDLATKARITASILKSNAPEHNVPIEESG